MISRKSKSRASPRQGANEGMIPLSHLTNAYKGGVNKPHGQQASAEESKHAGMTGRAPNPIPPLFLLDQSLSLSEIVQWVVMAVDDGLTSG